MAQFGIITVVGWGGGNHQCKLRVRSFCCSFKFSWKSLVSCQVLFFRFILLFIYLIVSFQSGTTGLFTYGSALFLFRIWEWGIIYFRSVNNYQIIRICIYPIRYFNGFLLDLNHSTVTRLKNTFTTTICIFTKPYARVGYDTRSIFKRSLKGLNSRFFLLIH